MKDSVIGMAHALTYDGEGLPEERDVSPPAAKSTDARNLTLPIGLVIAIAVFVAGFAYSQATQLAALRSDVRDIKTLMESQKENIELKLSLMKSDIEKSELRKALLDRMNPERK